jgi:hypothetical protein
MVMLRYVYDQPETVATAVAKMIPHLFGRPFGKCQAIGVIDEQGRMIAGIVYYMWHPEAGTIEIAVAALPKSRWFTRETVWRMYAYPFIDVGVQMCIHIVPADHLHSQRILATLGCGLTDIPRLFGRDRDAVLGLLTRETWESSKFHQRCARSRNISMEEAA